MARKTIASLEARVIELEQQLRFINDSMTCYTRHGAPKGACLVYLEDRPFFTALSNSAAYKLMSGIRSLGFRSVYKPLR